MNINRLNGECSAPVNLLRRHPVFWGGINWRRRKNRAPNASQQIRVNKEAGFTLIEILVVMIIIGLLAALVGPKLFGRVGKAKQNAARVQIKMFGQALELFHLDIGRYPTTAEGLDALRSDPGAENWAGTYTTEEIPQDPWNREYNYTSPGSHGDYDIFSYGLDGTEGGEGENGDVSSWKGLGQ